MAGPCAKELDWIIRNVIITQVKSFIFEFKIKRLCSNMQAFAITIKNEVI
jgi:hypothetical protein